MFWLRNTTLISRLLVKSVPNVRQFSLHSFVQTLDKKAFIKDFNDSFTKDKNRTNTIPARPRALLFHTYILLMSVKLYNQLPP